MSVNIIVAVDKNNVIGGDDERGIPIIPWKSSEDMSFFKQQTIGHTVIMGKRTYLSIPPSNRPLSDRNNIIISSTMRDDVEGVKVYRNVKDALFNEQTSNRDIYFIGGESIYKEVLYDVDYIYISTILDQYIPIEVDVNKISNVKRFPKIDERDFRIVRNRVNSNLDLKVYQRIGNVNKV